LIAAGCGFVAGLLLWVQLARWMLLLYVSGSKDGGDFLGPPRKRLLWALPFMALLHPAPWLIGATGFFGMRTMVGNSATGAKWFFGGLFLAVLLMSLTALLLLVRWHRSRQARVTHHLC
jgi:hypothetical protein